MMVIIKKTVCPSLQRKVHKTNLIFKSFRKDGRELKTNLNGGLMLAPE